MSVFNHPMDRDLRRLRRFIVWLLIFLLLPWLFVENGISCNQYSPTHSCRKPNDEPNYSGIPINIKARPIPVNYATALQYTPLSPDVVENWIQQHYPGANVNTYMLNRIAKAAKQWNLNELYLFGILDAEQGFLSPANGQSAYHNIIFQQNPFDYGVYPGSPFAFDIGAYESAMGAASMVVRVAESIGPKGWSSQGQWTTFMYALSGFYVNGRTSAVDLSWVHNVVYAMTGISSEFSTPFGVFMEIVYLLQSGMVKYLVGKLALEVKLGVKYVTSLPGKVYHYVYNLLYPVIYAAVAFLTMTVNTVFRWLYTEAINLFPSAAPEIESATTTVQDVLDLNRLLSSPVIDIAKANPELTVQGTTSTGQAVEETAQNFLDSSSTGTTAQDIINWQNMAADQPWQSLMNDPNLTISKILSAQEPGVGLENPGMAGSSLTETAANSGGNLVSSYVSSGGANAAQVAAEGGQIAGEVATTGAETAAAVGEDALIAGSIDEIIAGLATGVVVVGAAVAE